MTRRVVAEQIPRGHPLIARFAKLAAIAQNRPQHSVRIADVWLQADGLVACGDSPVQVILMVQGRGEVSVWSGKVRVEADGLFEHGDALVHFLFVDEGQSEVIPR